MNDDALFNYMSQEEDDECEAEMDTMQDCPDHLEHTAIKENEI
jgi:hypothetical protein